jgi:hypothetical protein
MVAPEGSPAPYWHLHKGLYRLRQAGRQWYLHLHDAYTSLGFTRCESDWSVYIRKTSSSLSISATSVDDLLLASNSKSESDLAASQIQQKFAITDGGDTQWLLGCRIRRWRDKRLLAIDQEQYTTQILTDFGMQHCNAVKTPCPTARLTSAMCPTTEDERREAGLLPYCAIVGKCMYLSNCTRPDISFAVRELAKYMSNYGPKHFEAAKHLLRYLQGTRSRGITYGNSPNPYPIFTSFTDSDWAMSEGRKSVSGFIIECGNAPLTWSSKQQVVVALSSCEAEYLACSHCARQIIWLWSLFEELGFPQLNPTPLYCDNQGTVACTHDPQAHSRMKHIDIQAHFIRDSVNRRFIDVHHIPGAEILPTYLRSRYIGQRTKSGLSASQCTKTFQQITAPPRLDEDHGGVLRPDHRPPCMDTTLPLRDPHYYHFGHFGTLGPFYVSSFLYRAYMRIYLYEP